MKTSKASPAATVPRRSRALALAGWIAACEGVGVVAGLLIVTDVAGWYSHLQKPSFNPPNWLFGPVWTILYALMGVAAWLVWRTQDSPPRSTGLRLFWLQLVLNFFWSMIFFRGHALLAAGVEILLLLATIVLTAAVFARISRTAALLMAPYAAWVAFASLLTWSVWQLNR